MTTNLSHRRPYRFPFDTQQFFWCAQCLGEYFPENVVEHMREKTFEVNNNSDGEVPEKLNETFAECSRHNGSPLYYMPIAPDIPVVIAARLSLSFPGLISAVPFQTIDRNRSKENCGIVTVWFSDGGICSNFPMRFFDSTWPRRPTFGINLSPQHPDYPEMVWRAKSQGSGLLPNYFPIKSLGGFFHSIVVVRHQADEGGMNLKMPAETIEKLANRGAEAARNIVYGDFATESPPFNFNLHRWIRYRVSMAGLDELLSGMYDVWTGDKVHESMSGFIRKSEDNPVVDEDGNHVYDAIDEDVTVTEELMMIARSLDDRGHPATRGSVPRPWPEVRLIPPL